MNPFSKLFEKVFRVRPAEKTRELLGTAAPDFDAEGRPVHMMGFVDGLLGPEIRVVCAKDVVDGSIEWCCQKCGGTEGLFHTDTAVDLPQNSMGVYIRLHKRCA